MKINRDKYTALILVLSKLFPSSTVEISQTYAITGLSKEESEDTIMWEVSSWSFHGTPDQAVEFAGYLMKASEIVESLNSLHLEHTYEVDEDLGRILEEEGEERANFAYDELKRQMRYYLINNNVEGLRNIIDHFIY